MLGISRIFQYFKEVQGEMSIVTWPTRAQTLRLTGLVIAASIGVGLIVGAIDLLFTEGFKLVIGK